MIPLMEAGVLLALGAWLVVWGAHGLAVWGYRGLDAVTRTHRETDALDGPVLGQSQGMEPIYGSEAPPPREPGQVESPAAAASVRSLEEEHRVTCEDYRAGRDCDCPDRRADD